MEEEKQEFASRLRKKNENLYKKVVVLENKNKRLKSNNSQLHDDKERFQKACYKIFSSIMDGDEKDLDPEETLDEIYNLLLEVNPKFEKHYYKKISMRQEKDPSLDMPINFDE